MYCNLSRDDILCLLIMLKLFQFCFFKCKLILLNKLALIVRTWIHYISVLFCSSLKELFIPAFQCELQPFPLACVQLNTINMSITKEN